MKTQKWNVIARDEVAVKQVQGCFANACNDNLADLQEGKEG